MKEEQRSALLCDIDKACDVLETMASNGMIATFRRREFVRLAKRLRRSSEVIRDGQTMQDNGDPQ